MLTLSSVTKHPLFPRHVLHFGLKKVLMVYLQLLTCIEAAMVVVEVEDRHVVDYADELQPKALSWARAVTVIW